MTAKRVKFLVIRFSSIGDIVLTSPVVRHIKCRIPDAEVHFVTKRAFAPLVANNPYIDKIHLLDDSLAQLINRLRAEKFDHIIDLHDNLRSFLIKRLLGVPSQTYCKNRIGRWLLVSAGINRMKGHIVERYMKTLLPWNIGDDGKGLDFFVAPDTTVDRGELPPAFASGFAVLVAGTMHFTKQLPLEKQIEICRGITWPILILGGKKEAELGEAIVRGANRDNLVNGCGAYSLSQSALWISLSKLVVTNDTGLMHIAAAYAKPILATYGNSVSAFGFDPYRVPASSQIFQVGLRCRPCSKFGGPACPKGHFNCMQQINSQAIVLAANAIMQQE